MNKKAQTEGFVWLIVLVLAAIVAMNFVNTGPPGGGNNSSGGCTMSISGLNCTPSPTPPPPVPLPPPPVPVPQSPGLLAPYGASSLSSTGTMIITGTFSVKYTNPTVLTQVDWYVNNVKYRSEFVAPYYLFGDDANTGFVNVSTFTSYPTTVCAHAFVSAGKTDMKCLVVNR